MSVCAIYKGDLVASVMGPDGDQPIAGGLNGPAVVDQSLLLTAHRAPDLSEMLYLRGAALDRVQEDQPVDHLGQGRGGQGAFVGGVVPTIGLWSRAQRVSVGSWRVVASCGTWTELLTWKEFLQVEPGMNGDAGSGFVDALQADDDLIEMLVPVLLAFERLHEHGQHC